MNPPAGGAPGVDLRSLVPSPVLIQHDRPLCLPLSVSTSHAVLRAQAAGHQAGDALSPEALWQHAHARGFTSSGGTDDIAMRDALQQQGQPELALWPFNDKLGHDTEATPPAAGLPPWHTAGLSGVQVARDGREQHLDSVLRSGRAVILAVEVTDEFRTAGPTGELPAPDPRAPLGELHAVTAVGSTLSRGAPAFLVCNTWGTGWGAGGYALLTAEWLAVFAAGAWTVT